MASGFVLTLISFFFPALYPSNRMLDDVLDFIGIIAILKGFFFRMVARGYKMRLSNQGGDLVTSGPYKVVRNPMYLGTYLLGAGFLLALAPWWMLPIYTFVFYRRFRLQINLEEKHLRKVFGERYEKYCRQVPRLFPNIFTIQKIRMKEAFPWADAWITKEKRAIIPALGTVVIWETVKEQCVYGSTDILITLLILSMAAGVFSLGLWVRYREN